MGLFDFLLNNQYQLYLDIQRPFDSRISPKSLLKEFQNKTTFKKFLKEINRPTLDKFKIVRRLHVCNLLLINSESFDEIFSNQVSLVLSNDKWLNQQFIRPYYQFMYKCSTSLEMYRKCKKCQIQQSNVFDQLFFIINLLKLLFKAINKMAMLGKFYKPKSPIVFQGVIQMIAIQGKQLYFTFKTILITILQNTNKFLITEHHQEILKNILLNDLAEINEEMKYLLLGKEFYPYGKAIGIKLFRIDEATKELEDTMRGIMTDHCQTNRRLEQEEMEDKLFNHKHGFNIKFFQETLTGGGSTPLLGQLRKQQQLCFKPPYSQEVVEYQQQSDQDDGQMQNSKKLADTGESDVNKVDNI